MCVFISWASCLAQECPEVAPSPSLCTDVSCARATRTSPFLREWSLLPRFQGLSPDTAWPQVIYHPWHHRKVLTTATYLHGDKFSSCFQLLRADSPPRTRTNHPEQDFAEEISSSGSEHLTGVSTISSLKCYSTEGSTQPSSCAFSILLFSTLCVGICSHPMFATAFTVQKESESSSFLWEDPVQIYNSCWHWTNYIFHINLIPMQTVCDLDFSCMDLLKGSRTMWVRNFCGKQLYHFSIYYKREG